MRTARRIRTLTHNSQASLEWTDRSVPGVLGGPEVLEGPFHPEGRLVPGRQESHAKGKLDRLEPRNTCYPDVPAERIYLLFH